MFSVERREAETLHNSITNTSAIVQGTFCYGWCYASCYGFVTGQTSISLPFYRCVTGVTAPEGGKGGIHTLQMITFPFSLSARPALTLYSTENSEEPFNRESLLPSVLVPFFGFQLMAFRSLPSQVAVPCSVFRS